ncbi:MAG TPA: glycosyltransferase family 39 protein [Bryobacteraceae bacterium]|nr:glycosyltransferase family 39 protein [Bryobacteraceae bacterium]
MEGRGSQARGFESGAGDSGVRYQVIVLLAAIAIFFGCLFSPPSLMDDVDAVQAQIARNMLDSGNWVTAHLDGIRYLEKAPLKYWMIAVSYRIFGVHDWAARLPLALSTGLLAWVTARFGAWAFSRRVGMYAGLAIATSVGVFLFTRFLIPDVILTLMITLAIWSLLRALEEQEPRPRLWAMIFWASMAVGLLLKGLIAAVFPVGAALVYLAVTKQLLVRHTWQRLRPFSGILLLLVIAAPWHILATLQNPPYFDFTLHSERGSYRGFFWFYFFNEHILRFLNRRYPRDYNTVPRLWFWLFHLLWLFPWSVYFPAVARLRFRGADRASRTRLMALCWTGFILAFFTFSTTQEYYSMPCYPALALLLASAIAAGGRLVRIGSRVAAVIAALAFVAIAGILFAVRGLPTPGDISVALNQQTDIYSAYTLSLGHMADLTLPAFAYLRLPLAVAGVAFLVGAIGAWRFHGQKLVASLVLMMVLFFHAARIAQAAFDPYMGSRALAEALVKAPPGELIVDNQYYTFSSVFFYANRTALLLNGRVTNLEYGSYAPGAPDIFLDDPKFAQLWSRPERYYLVAEGPQLPRLEALVGKAALHVVKESGGKYLFTNH